MDEHPQEPAEATSGSRRAVRVVIGVVVAIVVVYVLFTVVFPWVQEYQDDPTLEGAWVSTASLILR